MRLHPPRSMWSVKVISNGIPRGMPYGMTTTVPPLLRHPPAPSFWWATTNAAWKPGSLAHGVLKQWCRNNRTVSLRIHPLRTSATRPVRHTCKSQRLPIISIWTQVGNVIVARLARRFTFPISRWVVSLGGANLTSSGCLCCIESLTTY